MTTATFNMAERRGYRRMPRKQGIYQIRHLETGERYIGCTTNLHDRARTHASRLRNPSSPRRHRRLQAAVEEHGLRAFVFEVLETFEGDWVERDYREYAAINSVPQLGEEDDGAS